MVKLIKAPMGPNSKNNPRITSTEIQIPRDHRTDDVIMLATLCALSP